MAREELGSKPEKIDPAQILGETQTVGASEKRKLEKAWEEVDGQVERPDYNAARDEISNIPASHSSEPGHGIMSAGFNATVTVPEYIQGTLEQLSSIQRFFHGKDVQKVQRAQVLRLTKELFDYQYKDMQHLLLLGMDVQKKTRFVQYLNATKSLQNRIQNESAEAQRAVVSTMFENLIEAYKAKNKRDVEFDRMYKRGILDKKQWEKSKMANEATTDEHVERLNQTMKLLITRHAEFLHKTLELFKTKLIESGLF